MKKTNIIIALLLLLTPAAFALGRNDGSSKAHSIEFDWVNGHTQEPGYKWYRIDADTLWNYEYPEMTLTLTNLSEDSVSLTMDVTMPEVDGIPTKYYSMAAGESKQWIITSDQFWQLAPEVLFITLTTNQRISITASVREETETGVLSPAVTPDNKRSVRFGADGVPYIEHNGMRYSLTGSRL